MTLLLVGFVAALWISELLALRWCDIKVYSANGCTATLVMLKIQKLKTNINHMGQWSHLPQGLGSSCPIRWLSMLYKVRHPPQDSLIFTHLDGHAVAKRYIA